MAETITIPDLENGKVDIDTLADIVNLQEPTTVTRLSGPVNTWFGVQASLTAASGLAYTTKAAMDASPGTESGQAARVTEGADKGLYIWSGSAWVKTSDPLTDFDSLTINSGKDHPMVAVSRGGGPPAADVHPAYKEAILDIKIQNARPGYFYRLGNLQCQVDEAGVNKYGLMLLRIPEDRLTDGYEQLVISTENPRELRFDYAKGGVQTLSVRGYQDPETIITVTADVSKLPVGTTIQSNNNTASGFNSIISPDGYTYQDEYVWREGDCFVEYTAADGKLMVGYKSGVDWFRYHLQKKAINQTFTLLGFGRAPAYNAWGDIIPVEFAEWVTVVEAMSDYLGPVVFHVVNNADPVVIPPQYTSGSHSTDPIDSNVGLPTAESILLNIYVDGVLLDLAKDKKAKCETVSVETANKVLAWNTIESRRWAMEEYFSLGLSAKGMFVHKTTKALEDIVFTADGACQMYFAGFTPLSSVSYLMFGSKQTARTNFGPDAFDSGLMRDYPKVYGVSARLTTARELSSWCDPNYGVGTRETQNPNDHVMLNFPRENGKMYYRLFGSVDYPLNAGDTYVWRGGYYIGKSTETANFDTVLHTQAGVIAVKPNGTYAIAGDDFAGIDIAIENKIRSEGPYLRNSGANFPFVQRTRLGTTSPSRAEFDQAFLSAQVFGATRGKLYKVRMFINQSTAISGADPYGVWIEEFDAATYDTAGVSDGLAAIIRTSPQPPWVRGGVQTMEYVSTIIPGLSFKFVIDTDALPPSGTLIDTSSQTSAGFSWIIDPAVYDYIKQVDLTAVNASITTLNNEVDTLSDSIDMTDADVDVLTGRVDSIEQPSTLQQLHEDLIHPLKTTNVRTIGDSITWGSGATGIAPTEPRTGTLSDPRNNLTSLTWVNRLRDWMGTAYAGGERIEILREDQTHSGSGYYESTKIVDALGADFSYFDFKNIAKTLTRAEVVPTISTSTSAGQYLDIFRWGATTTATSAIEFDMRGTSFDILYSALSTGNSTDNVIEVFSDGVKIGQFSQWTASPAFKQSVTFTVPYGNHRIRIVNSSVSAAFRFEGIRFTKQIKVSNDGINGSASRSWLLAGMIDAAVIPEDDYVFLQIGTNDRIYRADGLTDPYRFEGNLRTLISRIGTASSGNAKLIMMAANAVTQSEAPYPESVYLYDMKKVNQIIKVVAEQNGIDFISNYEATVQLKVDGTSYLADGLHPNDNGYLVIFLNILNHILYYSKA